MASEIAWRVNANNLKDAFRAAFDRASKQVLLGTHEIVLREEKRSNDANRKLWAMLNDVASQIELCVNGRMQRAAPEDWKAVFTAALNREQRMAMGLDGGVVFLGTRTSKMRRREFSELIELIYAAGTERGVVWSEKAMECYAEYREARA